MSKQNAHLAESREAFVGDMPREYAESTKAIARKIAQLEKKLWSTVDEDVWYSINEQLSILRDMYDSTLWTGHTIANYYKPGATLNPRYALSARTPKRHLMVMNGRVSELPWGTKRLRPFRRLD